MRTGNGTARFSGLSIRGRPEHDPIQVRALLKEVYYAAHRSSFVHGGREVSPASLMADSIGSSYLKHVVEGREVRTPGLSYSANDFERGANAGRSD